MFRQRHRFCLLFLAVGFFLIPRMSWAQPEDSTKERKGVVIVDSSISVPVEDDEEYEDYIETTVSKYFSRRDLQPNGGGPDSLQYRSLPDTTIANMRADDAFWYVDAVFKKKKIEEEEDSDPTEGTSIGDSSVLQTLLWLAIIGGFVAFVIIYLANSNVSVFRRRGKALLSKGGDIDVETDNIFEINYQKEIDKAIGKGNYRFAVRLMFLRLLKTLADKEIIQYKQDRTNFDYLMQLYPTRHYNDFFRLTRNYEYSWYGQFDIDHDKFSVIKHDFDSFDTKLTS